MPPDLPDDQTPTIWGTRRRSTPCPGGCVLAVVGSTVLQGNVDAMRVIREAFERHNPRWFVSGGAVGVDSMAEYVANERGLTNFKTIHHPERRGWYWYKKRDRLIAQDAECLVRVYAGWGRTWGSGWTAREAERLGARVERIKIGEGAALP